MVELEGQDGGKVSVSQPAILSVMATLKLYLGYVFKGSYYEVGTPKGRHGVCRPAKANINT